MSNFTNKILESVNIINHLFKNKKIAWAYKMTKDISRQNTVQWLIDNKQKDLDFVLEYMQSPHIQKSLGLYLQSLKK